MYNRVELIGNLGADPEVRTGQNGRKFATLRLATSERWKDASTGEKREHTDWHTVVIFNEGLAGVAEKYLRKGSRVFVAGKMSTRKWQAPDGSDRYSTEVVVRGFEHSLQMLDRAEGSGYRPGGDGEAADAGRPAPASHPDLDDEIPF